MLVEGARTAEAREDADDVISQAVGRSRLLPTKMLGSLLRGLAILLKRSLSTRCSQNLQEWITLVVFPTLALIVEQSGWW